MTGLPTVGGDSGAWGAELNAFLSVAHNADGTPKLGNLTPTAVKPSAYTASAGDFVPVDTTSGNVTVTLPVAPPDLTVVAVKHVIQGGTNTVTITCGGSDVFNKTAGATTGTLTLLAQGMLLQYRASGGIWYVTADDLPLPQLDNRYTKSFSPAAYGGDPTGVADSTSAINSAVAAAVAAGGGYVTFGPGTWKSDTITVPGLTSGTYMVTTPAVHFLFTGPGVTILTPLNANSPLFKLSTSGGQHYSAGNRFEGGFTVLAHASGSTGPAIDLTGARQWVIESPSYWDSLKGAAGTPGTYNQVIGLGLNTYACSIKNPICEGQRLGNGFIGAIDTTNCVANDNTVTNVLFEGNTATYMIDAAGTYQLTVEGGISEGNTVTAEIRLGYRTAVKHVWFEGGTGVTFAMNVAGVDTPSLGYDPGGCLLEHNDYNQTSTLTIPAGVHPYTKIVGSFNNRLTVVDNTDTLITDLQVPDIMQNDASAGSNATVVTTANSGGLSGHAFDTVTGSPAFSTDQFVPPSALSYKLVTSASTKYLSWNMRTSSTLTASFYVYFSGAAFNTYLFATTGLAYNVTCNGAHITARAVPGSTVTSTTTSVAGTWYRIAVSVDLIRGTTEARIYNASDVFLERLFASGGTANVNTVCYFGGAPSNTTTGTLYLAGPTVSTRRFSWPGPVLPPAPNTTVPLADTSTVAVDASLGNSFRVTLGGNRTLGNPANPAYDGQEIIVEVIQDAAGSRTLAYDTQYTFSVGLPSPVLTTTASKRDFLKFKYNATAAKWYCLAWQNGF